MPKVDRIIALMENRIRRGDYSLRPLPAESKLALETGVSRMTARKAVLRLVGQGLLTRASNGRLVIRADATGGERRSLSGGKVEPGRSKSGGSAVKLGGGQGALAARADGAGGVR